MKAKSHLAGYLPRGAFMRDADQYALAQAIHLQGPSKASYPPLAESFNDVFSYIIRVIVALKACAFVSQAFEMLFIRLLTNSYILYP